MAPGPPGSIRFDAQELHDLTPFLGFVGDELGEVTGREREHGTTEVGIALTGSPSDFGKLIVEETEKWGKVVKFAGVRAD